MIESIEPVTLALFTRVLKWSEVETQVFMAHVRNEFLEGGKQLFVNCHFIYGRKAGWEKEVVA
jgi:hypothetical protein